MKIIKRKCSHCNTEYQFDKKDTKVIHGKEKGTEYERYTVVTRETLSEPKTVKGSWFSPSMRIAGDVVYTKEEKVVRAATNSKSLVVKCPICDCDNYLTRVYALPGDPQIESTVEHKCKYLNDRHLFKLDIIYDYKRGAYWFNG